MSPLPPLALLVASALAFGLPGASALTLSARDVALNATRGQAMLRAAAARSTYVLLANMETQITQSFCSVATSTMLLNSLAAEAEGNGRRVGIPVDPVYAPYPYFTQRNILENVPCVAQVNTHNGDTLDAQFIALHGATLDEWAGYLACHADVKLKHHARPGGVAEFRAEVERAYGAQPSGALVAVNFDRKGVDELGGGHMSPIAAYHKDAESGDEHVLLLDVSRYKYPPVWLHLEDLYGAMATLDSTSGLNRGFVVASARGEGSLAVGIEQAQGGAVDRAAQRACLQGPGAARWDGMLACLGGGGQTAVAPSASSQAAMAPASAGVLGGLMGFAIGGASAYAYVSVARRHRTSRAFASLQHAGDVDIP